MSSQPIAPENVDQLKQWLTSENLVLPVGNQTKRPLCSAAGVTLVSLRAMSGIVEYEPSEFTFTARGGTPVAEIADVLRQKRQYLPFDPMLCRAGATIGGTVASGLAGPGRFRYGGIRDFLLGVQFVSGDGELINAGGKVVKNAAGFDIPKFLVGSLGRFGVMTQLTFKVFPLPDAVITLRIECQSHRQAIDRMSMIAASHWELDAVDYRPDLKTVFLRLRGPHQALQQIERSLPAQWGARRDDEGLDKDFWSAICELDWRDLSSHAIKIPTTPSQSAQLIESLEQEDEIALHSSVAGNLVWALVRSPDAVTQLDLRLKSQGLSGLVVRGDWHQPRLGDWPASQMVSRVKAAIDPPSRFPGFQVEA